MTTDLRAHSLHQWLQQQWQQPLSPPTPIFADASHRRYFRYWRDGKTEIAMDAPPELEDCQPFIAMTTALTKHGLPVPQLLAQDLNNGFLCLTDLGDTHLYARLVGADPVRWYQQALALLPRFASLPDLLPAYSEQMLRTELELFPEWMLQTHLNEPLPPFWPQLVELLVSNAVEQPQVAVHRDFHSRNLMVIDEQLGLIDYQGAVRGPISYDSVSLLRDCYLDLSEDKLKPLLEQHVNDLKQAGLLPLSITLVQFKRWFDLMGIQRHLKAAGIFARLAHRDSKSGYLNDLPRVFNYLIRAGHCYPETQPLAQWVEQQLLPKLNELSQ